MAEGQYDVARSSCSLLGCFAAFGLEPRRVGGPTRHGGGQCDVARSFGSLLGSFAALEAEPRRVGGPTRHGGAQYDVAGSSCSLLALFWAVLPPLGASHVALEVQRDMAGTQCDVAGPSQSCTAFFWALQHIKSHPRTRSEVADFMLICFLVCLTCQLGH